MTKITVIGDWHAAIYPISEHLKGVKGKKVCLFLERRPELPDLLGAFDTYADQYSEFKQDTAAYTAYLQRKTENSRQYMIDFADDLLRDTIKETNATPTRKLATTQSFIYYRTKRHLYADAKKIPFLARELETIQTLIDNNNVVKIVPADLRHEEKFQTLARNLFKNSFDVAIRSLLEKAKKIRNKKIHKQLSSEVRYKDWLPGSYGLGLLYRILQNKDSDRIVCLSGLGHFGEIKAFLNLIPRVDFTTIVPPEIDHEERGDDLYAAFHAILSFTEPIIAGVLNDFKTSQGGDDPAFQALVIELEKIKI